jgi:hypothetical protein
MCLPVRLLQASRHRPVAVPFRSQKPANPQRGTQISKEAARQIRSRGDRLWPRARYPVTQTRTAGRVFRWVRWCCACARWAGAVAAPADALPPRSEQLQICLFPWLTDASQQLQQRSTAVLPVPAGRRWHARALPRVRLLPHSLLRLTTTVTTSKTRAEIPESRNRSVKPDKIPRATGTPALWRTAGFVLHQPVRTPSKHTIEFRWLTERTGPEPGPAMPMVWLWSPAGSKFTF